MPPNPRFTHEREQRLIDDGAGACVMRHRPGPGLVPPINSLTETIKRAVGPWIICQLSSPYENVRGMRLSLVIETGDGVVDRAFESIGTGDGSIGQIMLLEVAPASFDSLPRT
jgi:hypothetical protein